MSRQLLAYAPERRDPSSYLRPRSKYRGLVRRAALTPLLLALACSHVQPKPATGTAGTPASTPSLARHESPMLPVGPASREDVAEKNAEPLAEAAKAAPMASAPKDKKAGKSPKPAPAPAAKGEAAMDAMGSVELGLIGIGVGGGGIAQGGRRSGTITRSSHARAPLAVVAASAAPTEQEPEFNTEGYKSVHDNPFRLVKNEPLSTFSADVDTASYSNMRRFVEEGRLPPEDSIRVEEWVNYFSYDDPEPAAGEPVGVSTELTDCPWNPRHRLLRVALSTTPIPQAEVPPRNLVFLVDVSGSMEDANKLPLLKRGMALLARQLRPVDTLSVVVYAGASGLALPPTSGGEQAKILGTLEKLQAGGSTNGGEGIRLAYEMARRQFKKGGINRVVLATDGDFNVGTTSEGELERLITDERKSGVFLTVLGFGTGNLKDSTMETLADKGNGNYAYIDSLGEARKVLVKEAGATLVTVAQDVKLQVEWNPSRVSGYRLVGYENRVLANEDFNDDKKDAGDLGAGHHVTAFYEIVPAGSTGAANATPGVDPLKYQTERAPSSASASGELATLKIRWKPPTGTTSALMTRGIADRVVPLPSASERLRWSAAVAEMGLSLRHAPGLGKGAFASARALASSAVGSDATGERREFLSLMDKASSLGAGIAR